MTVTISGTSGISGADGSVGTPAFQGTDTNTGVYFPGANRLGFATDGTQRGEFDASGNFQFNSGYGSVATAYGCRAWVNFNGTGTVAIRASGNVTSITDNGTGDYTINFTTAMPDVNYSSNISIARCAGNTTLIPSNRIDAVNTPTASAFRFQTGVPDSSRVFQAEDSAWISVSIFR